MPRGDRISATIDDDRLTGGAFDDTLLGGLGADRLRGRGGADRLAGQAGRDTLIGDAGRDTLIGGGGNDALFGGGGRDRMLGGGGRDRLVGALGDDTLEGGGGEDRLFGGAGADRLAGGASRDTLKGGAGDDLLLGGGGNDRLVGGGGGDRLMGGAGNDHLFGGGGADSLFGGKGGDTLAGGAGADLLAGGGGADLFIFRAADGAATDRIRDFAPGADRISLRGFKDIDDFGDLGITNGGAGAVVDLGGGRRIVLEGIDRAALTAADFGLPAAPQTGKPPPVAEPFFIDGGAGPDMLEGGATSQHLRGFGGDDVLITSGGGDTLTGGAGADLFLIRLAAGALDATPDVVSDFQFALGDMIGVAEAVQSLSYTSLDEVVRATPGAAGTMISIDRGAGFEDALLLAGVQITMTELLGYGFDAPALASGGFVDNPNGFQNSTTTSADPDITPNGRFVAFVDKQNLDGNPDDNASVFEDGDPPILDASEATLDVFVRNMATGAVIRASGDGAGGVMTNYAGVRLDAMSPSISADGRVVAFAAAPNSFVAAATIGDVYVRNLFTDAAPVLVSVTPGGDAAGGVPVGARNFTSSSGVVALSGDGGVVAFVSAADGLSASLDVNGELDVYVRDLAAGVTRLASVIDIDGTKLDGSAGGGVMNAQRHVSSVSSPRPTGDAVALSFDGRYVAFVTDARLLANDRDGLSDVYLRDMKSGQTILVSAGVEGAATSVDMSADGARVVFSTEVEPAAGEIFPRLDVHLAEIDLKAGLLASVERLSVNRHGVEFESAQSEGAKISAEGARIAFRSSANAPEESGLVYVLDLDQDALFFAPASYDSFPNNAFDPSSDRLALRVDAIGFSDTIAVVDLAPVPGDGLFL